MANDENLDGRSNCEQGWTIATYAAHNEALRLAEAKFQNERDRRYMEVKATEEKAIRVKEQADRDALDLAREIQNYKDEKANELREQINRERGLYVTQTELSLATKELAAMIKPLTEFVSASQGGRLQSNADVSRKQWVIPVILSIVIPAIAGICALIMFLIKNK